MYMIIGLRAVMMQGSFTLYTILIMKSIDKLTYHHIWIQYVEEGDFLAYYTYCKDNDLSFYSFDRTHSRIYAITMYYCQLLRDVQEDLYKDSFNMFVKPNRESNVSGIVKTYENFMREFSDNEELLEEYPHLQEMADVADSVISFYYHIPYEEMDEFRGLSTIQKNIVILEKNHIDESIADNKRISVF